MDPSLGEKGVSIGNIILILPTLQHPGSDNLPTRADTRRG